MLRTMMVGTALLLFGAQAHAQMVYKCVAKGKPTAFQSAPCAADQRTAKAVYAPPDRERPRPVQQSQAATTTTHQYASAAAPGITERDRQRAECTQAKAQRASTLNAVGLNRTHDLLRQLDAAVYAACQGL